MWAVGYGAAAGYGLWFRYVKPEGDAKPTYNPVNRGERLTISIYPVDVIKSKIQTDALDPTKRQYKGMIDCVRKTWSKEGWRGFTGGLGPTLIR